MLKIAYCDDQERERNYINMALMHINKKWNEEFEIYAFSSGESLCEGLERNQFDIIFLDILMGGIDGIETATRIRAMGKNSLIIFISSYDERIKELFNFRTVGFLDKPYTIEALENELLKAYNIIKNDIHNFYVYSKNGTLQYQSIRDIVYFETQRNKIILHTTNGEDSFYGTLSSVWAKIQKDEQFIMPHKSFVFNLNYTNIKANKVIIKSTGEYFNIGDKFKADTQDRYAAFLEKRCR